MRSAYVEFIHSVERLYEASTTGPHGPFGETKAPSTIAESTPTNHASRAENCACVDGTGLQQ
jgi:hypothetical protein